MKVIGFDVDETLECSAGPVPLQVMLDLKQAGFMVGLIGNWGHFFNVVPEFWKYINFVAVGLPKDEWMRHFATYTPAEEFILVGNELGVTGKSDDRGSAERAGWTFVREDAFATWFVANGGKK